MKFVDVKILAVVGLIIQLIKVPEFTVTSKISIHDQVHIVNTMMFIYPDWMRVATLDKQGRLNLINLETSAINSTISMPNKR